MSVQGAVHMLVGPPTGRPPLVPLQLPGTPFQGEPAPVDAGPANARNDRLSATVSDFPLRRVRPREIHVQPHLAVFRRLKTAKMIDPPPSAPLSGPSAFQII